VQYLGADVRVHAELPDGTRVIAAVPASSITDVSAGRAVTLTWPASAAFALAGAEHDSVTDDWGDEP
jgi:TOBE domain